MSTRPPNNSIGPLNHLALHYLRQALDMSHPTDEPYVLNPVESRLIRRTKLITLSLVALLSIAGVLLFYWPQYSWPALFRPTAVQVFATVYALPLVTILYAFLLIYLEVSLLLTLNLWGVKMIMDVCGFPRAHDARYEQHLQALADGALKQPYQYFFPNGVTPYLHTRWGLFVLFLLSTTKAALTTLVVKFSLTRFLGQYALRQTVNMTALPVYALWNTWTSWQLLHEAQVRVMAPTTIREFVHELYEEWGRNDEFPQLILGALQHISILERQYNYAHFLLTETIMDRFNLTTNVLPSSPFVEQALLAPLAMRRSLERLIVFSVLIDGKLSWLEKRQLSELRQRGFLTYSADEIQRISTDYNEGRGLWV